MTHARINRVLLDRDELVERVTKACEAKRAETESDYQQGYVDALLDTLDLLTGFVGRPVKEHHA